MKYLYLIICGAVLSGCGDGTHPPVSENRFLMGTYVTITGYDETTSEDLIRAAIGAAFGEIEKIEAETSPYDSSSNLGRMNQKSTRKRSFRPHGILDPIIRDALDLARRTDGALDITIWPVFKLWHFDTPDAEVPDAAVIAAALQRRNLMGIHLGANGEVELDPGIEIDVSSINKGFAVESARKVLRDAGMNNFIIDAGGNLGIEWHKEQPVEVYLRHPRKNGEYWATFPITKSCGIATSGDYHFYFMKDGKRYHHIIDPASGYPASGAVSVTVIAPTATEADGLSTAIFVMGREKGAAFIESSPNVEGAIIYEEDYSLHTYASAGLRQSLHILDESSP